MHIYRVVKVSILVISYILCLYIIYENNLFLFARINKVLYIYPHLFMIILNSSHAPLYFRSTVHIGGGGGEGVIIEGSVFFRNMKYKFKNTQKIMRRSYTSSFIAI